MKFSLRIVLIFALAFVAGVARGQVPEEKEWSAVQIVNATSVPTIAVYVNKQLLYPDFPQGLYTGDAPLPYSSARYQALFMKARLASQPVTVDFAKNEKQTMLITGDFSKTHPPDELPQPGATPSPPPEGKKEYEPNVQFRVLSHSLSENEKPLRYRFFNAMPKKHLSVRSTAGASSGTVAPGKDYSFLDQPPYETFVVTVDDVETEVLINQQGHERNCTVVFFLKDGKPEFSRSFENTEESDKRATEQESKQE